MWRICERGQACLNPCMFLPNVGDSSGPRTLALQLSDLPLPAHPRPPPCTTNVGNADADADANADADADADAKANADANNPRTHTHTWSSTLTSKHTPTPTPAPVPPPPKKNEGLHAETQIHTRACAPNHAPRLQAIFYVHDGRGQQAEGCGFYNGAGAVHGHSSVLVTDAPGREHEPSRASADTNPGRTQHKNSLECPSTLNALVLAWSTTTKHRPSMVRRMRDLPGPMYRPGARQPPPPGAAPMSTRPPVPCTTLPSPARAHWAKSTNPACKHMRTRMTPTCTSTHTTYRHTDMIWTRCARGQVWRLPICTCASLPPPSLYSPWPLSWRDGEQQT